MRKRLSKRELARKQRPHPRAPQQVGRKADSMAHIYEVRPRKDKRGFDPASINDS
jgi:hypothetical protein